MDGLKKAIAETLTIYICIYIREREWALRNKNSSIDVVAIREIFAPLPSTRIMMTLVQTPTKIFTKNYK